jgi:phosphatidylglycerol---prolipoprotein diacylglyceryl transferase
MIIHNFDPTLIDLGFFQIKWYSIAYIMGIILGWAYALKIIKKIQNNTENFEPIKRSDFDDLLVYLVLGIILGGRLGYVIFYNLEYYIHNSFQIFKLWQGGMSFHGGLLGVIAAIFIFSKNKNTNFFKYSDIVSCVAPIGIFLGRIANFINGELFGKISTLPWAVIFPNGGNVARHPSQIYEAILEGLVLFVLINFLAFKKNLIIKTGYVSSFFLIIYSILRIFSENFREPDQHLGYFFNYFSMGILLSVLTLISGFLIIFFINKNEQNN